MEEDKKDLRGINSKFEFEKLGEEIENIYERRDCKNYTDFIDKLDYIKGIINDEIIFTRKELENAYDTVYIDGLNKLRGTNNLTCITKLGIVYYYKNIGEDKYIYDI